MREFNYEIKKELGTISKSKGYQKAVKLISYNGADPKVDIRSWRMTEDGLAMGKGITLTKEEAKKLLEILEGLEL